MRLDSPFADLPTAMPAAGTLPLGEPRLDAALNGGLRTDGREHLTHPDAPR